MAAVVLTGLACFHLPGWDADLTIPLISETFYAHELLDSTLFRPGPDSVMEFHLELGLDTIRAKDQFGEFEGGDTFVLELDSFVVTPLLDVAAGVGIEELVGQLPADSVFMPVPGFERELVMPGSLPGVEHAELAGGFLRALVENRTTLRLDTVRLALAGIGMLDFGTLDSMGTAERRIDLAGVVLGPVLDARLRFGSAGTGPESVWVRVRDSVLVRLVIDSVRLRNGRIRLGDSTRMRSDHESVSWLRTEHHIRLDTARFRQGYVEFDLVNRFPLPLAVALSVAEFGFDSSVTVDAGGRSGFRFDLADRGYVNSGGDSSRLTLAAAVEAVPTGEVVDLTEDQSFEVRFATGELELSYLAGEALDTVWSPELEDTLAVDFPEEISRVKFARIRLAGMAYNAAQFRGVFDLRVTALNPAGESASVVTTVVLEPGTPQHPATSTTDVDIACLFNLAPDRLLVSGRVGLHGPGRAWWESWVTGRLNVRTPLRAKLLADTFRFGPWRIPVDSSVRPRPGRDLRSAEVIVHAVNHLPARLAADLELRSTAGDRARVPLVVPEPELEPGSGRVVAASDSVLTLVLDEAGSRVFYAEAVNVEVVVYVPTTDTITLMATDYFRIGDSRARLTLELEPR